MLILFQFSINNVSIRSSWTGKNRNCGLIYNDGALVNHKPFGIERIATRIEVLFNWWPYVCFEHVVGCTEEGETKYLSHTTSRQLRYPLFDYFQY